MSKMLSFLDEQNVIIAGVIKAVFANINTEMP